MSIFEEDFIKAAENGQLDIVNQAIDQGVDINCRDVSGREMTRPTITIAFPPTLDLVDFSS